MESDKVSAAIELLLDELEKVSQALDKTGSDAFRAREYERARELATLARKATELRSEVVHLKSEFKRLLDGIASVFGGKHELQGGSKETRTGIHMQESDFVLPILEALVELGGSASVAEVLQRVYEKVKDRLTEHDLQPLRSNPLEPRWRKNAQWCRYRMVRSGLLKRDSPVGIWEISEKGRAELARLRETGPTKNW